MALIELHLQNPAFKRVESAQAAGTTEATETTETTDAQGEATATEDDDTATTDHDDTTDGVETSVEESGGRVGRFTAILGTLLVGLIGVLTLRKLRTRRRSNT